MTKTRLTTLLLTHALALDTAPAVLAQDESPAPDEAATSEELGPFADVDQLEAAQGFYADYAEAMGELGIVGASLDFSTDWLEGWFGGMADMDVDVDEAEAAEEVSEAEAEVEDEMAEAEDELAEASEEVEEEKEEAKEQASD